MYVGLLVKYPLLLSDFNETLPFSLQTLENTQISNIIEIRQVEVQLLHAADGRTDKHDKADSRFLQSCERA